MRSLLFLLPLWCAASCLIPSSARITAKDLAQAVPEFAQLAPELEISFAPQPGHTRSFPAGELRARLERNGIRLAQDTSVCFEWPMQPLDADRVLQSMRSALPTGSEVRLLSAAAPDAPSGTPVFEAAGLSRDARTWRGHVAYAPGLKFSLALPVEIRAPYRRVLATSPIRAGQRITSDVLRLEEGIGLPQPAGTIERIDDAAGFVARRLIPAGSPLTRQALGEARGIAKGDPVQVLVVSGAARLRLDGIAQQPAAIGALVAVKISDTGRIIHPRLEDNGRATLDLSPHPTEN